MRKPVIAGNWKLHKTQKEALALAESLKAGASGIDDAEIVIAPVFTSLSKVAEALAGSNIAVAAQNCYPENSGAYTGEVSPALLRDAGCRHVILGHSERRQLFGENDAFINRKVKAVLAENLGAILCVGETLEERDGGEVFDVLTRQVCAGLDGVAPAALSHVIVAYEPVWAIGTGRTASNEQAEDAHSFIRGIVSGQFGAEAGQALRILYGGSVKPENIDGLMSQPDIDGALVGGASLKAEDFLRIIRFARN
jgi:triosephosphate isomerase (TIM)